jgi:hypothetical protein
MVSSPKVACGRKLRLAIACLALLAGVVILFVANQQFVAASPGGNDFLVHWVGTRALLIEKVSPYSDTVAMKIQTLAYGRPAQPGEHELRVAYPLYSIALFAPFAMVADYALARSLWMTVLEVALLGLALAGLRLARWLPSLPVAAAYLLFAVTWYHGFRPLVNGNAVIVVALLIALAMLAIRAGRDGLAGALLAMSTIKPQVVLLLVLFVGVWAIATRRWRLVIGFLGTLAALLALSLALLPSWPAEFLREVIRYPAYNPPGTLGAALEAMSPGLGAWVGWGVTLVLGVLLLVEWRTSMGQAQARFEWAVNLTLAASCWIGIQTDPGNFIVLLAPLAAILASIANAVRRGGEVIALAVMVVLHAGLWTIFVSTLERGPQPVQGPAMFIPLPFIVLAGLYGYRRRMVEAMQVESR